jgi:hypothetical protein
MNSRWNTSFGLCYDTVSTASCYIVDIVFPVRKLIVIHSAVYFLGLNKYNYLRNVSALLTLLLHFFF